MYKTNVSVCPQTILHCPDYYEFKKKLSIISIIEN